MTASNWEVQHADWRALGIDCPGCEADRERSIHRAASRNKRAARAMDRACRWDGFVLTLLRFRTRFRDRRASARNSDVDATDDAAFRECLRRLKISAVAQDTILDGLRIRGPVQSRPQWELDVEFASARATVAWSAYADALWGDDAVTIDRQDVSKNTAASI